MTELNENSMRLMLDNDATIREKIEDATGLKRYTTRSLLIDGSVEKATEEQLNSIADILNVSTSELVKYLHKRNKEYLEYFDTKESDIGKTNLFGNDKVMVANVNNTTKNQGVNIMRKEYKFSENDLLEVMESVDSKLAEEVEKLAGITFSLKEEKEAYVGANLTHEREFYLGNIFGVTGRGELTEIFGFINDEDELVITELIIAGKAKYTTNYIDLTGENIEFPSGWTIRI